MKNKIIFMGTPDFAVESLRQLIEAGMEVAAVVTSPDRPAGRGQQVSASAVKVFALEHKIEILQPEKLKSPDFNEALKRINADLFVVVAFRMLPEIVWSLPPLGTINLHGSLLPQYRGAAPINWAVINGDTETGATTFFIEKEIDTGKIIDHVKIPIEANDTAGTVHDRLMVKGAALLTQTVKDIFAGEVKAKDQSEYIKGITLKHAPKIFKKDCLVDWNDTTENIHNKIRGLSPYPTAWTKIKDASGKVKTMKLFQTLPNIDGKDHEGKIKLDEDRVLFGAQDGWLEILELQLEGKRRMSIEQFKQGFKFENCELV